MTRRTKLIAALSAIALLAVTAFLLFPALFPGLDPSEEVSKGSDAKIRAQDSSSGTGSLAKCTYSYESGAVRTVYSDGRELYKFQGGHRLEIEAKREAGDRTAVATYEDGTIRREIFEYDTSVEQMVYRIPREVEWFQPDGSPRSKPDAGKYPELWDKVGEFTSSGGSPSAHVGPDHPWKKIWPGVEPPGLDEEDEDIFGPVRRVWRDPDKDQIWSYFADRTVKVAGRGSALYENRGVQILLIYYPNGDREYYYLGRDEGYPSVCPDTRQELSEDVVRYVKIKYRDGLARIFYVRGSVKQTELSQAERFCEVWERDGERVDAPSNLDEYPIRDFPARQIPPPELFYEGP